MTIVAEPLAPSGAETVETLLARVHLVGDRAYKLRRAIRTPFVDQRTAEVRRRLCDEDLRLNEELAPGVYLRVLAAVERDGELRLVAPDSAPPAQVVDHAVEMRRLDAARALPALVRRGAAHGDLAAELGARLAGFHGGAARAPEGATDVFERTVALNGAELAAAARGLVAPAVVDDVRALLDDGLWTRRAELEAREASGLAVDGHGDLRAEHVYACADGLKVIDRLEFDPHLRHGDVALDLGFLLMDLERLGAPGFARDVLTAYRAAGGHPGDDGLLALMGCHRGLVRAKVALLRVASGAQSRGTGVAEAEEHLELAARLAWRARWGATVLAVCGAPACGKSTLAAAIADRTGWRVLSSDVLRKAARGLAPTDRAGREAYGEAATVAVYRELGRAAAEALRDGRGVVVDATFAHRAWREAFVDGLGRCAPATRFVECVVPHRELTRRAVARVLDPARVSDADVTTAVTLSAGFQALEEVPADQHVLLRADRPTAALLRELERRPSSLTS
ncbi:bifunctional aminoglycoside phosphotransferase/ATP-binding protein [Conexibacter sp. SYSU D00693]|uniref:bifunctional aminoglycoside phosphotransferase/ATP-binding protein n=1 Tax=Conexibacter sp. SYSU D00693 TaxID=2812560 RepID=UPI00196B293F|nr:bifunctional aminoglycoside phosphotransferase/ATP-binding protein [Conexibacter sp. SYSU D00693]